MRLDPERAVRACRLRQRYSDLLGWRLQDWVDFRGLIQTSYLRTVERPLDVAESERRTGKPIPVNRRYLENLSKLRFDRDTLGKLRVAKDRLQQVNRISRDLARLNWYLNSDYLGVENLENALKTADEKCNPNSREYDRWFRYGFERLHSSRILLGIQLGTLFGIISGLTFTAGILPLPGQVVAIFGAIALGRKVGSLVERARLGYQTWLKVRVMVRQFSRLNGFPAGTADEILRERSSHAVLQNLKNKLTVHLQNLAPNLNRDLIERSVDQVFQTNRQR